MTKTDIPIHEPSVWLRGRVNQRVADVRDRGLDPCREDALIVTPLGTTEDRGCDRCGRTVPDGEQFYVAAMYALPGLLLVGGFCDRCADAEMLRGAR